MDTEDDARKLGYEVGAIFCTFLQGVVLGWGTIDRGVGRAKQGLSLIIDDRSILMDGGMEAALFEAVKTRAE